MVGKAGLRHVGVVRRDFGPFLRNFSEWKGDEKKNVNFGGKWVRG